MMTTEIECKIQRGRRVKADPAVSIVIPNYNTAAYISQTLDSVFAQSFGDFEVIVINDGAPDTEEFLRAVEPYLDSIVLIAKEINEGTAATRNRAASCARGGHLAFLDADDLWFPDALSKLHAFALETGFEVVYADCETFTTGSDKFTDLSILNPVAGEITRDTMVDGRAHILPSGAIMRRAAFEKVGGFDPRVERTEDFDLWMRMLFSGCRIGHLDEVLFRFRLSSKSGSGDAVVRLERCNTAWRILQQKLDFTEDENRKIERHIAEYEAAVVRARGRDAIFRGSWSEAIGHLSDAKSRAELLGLPLSHRLKLSAVLIVLNIAPTLARKVYTTRRREELEFLPTSVRQDEPLS